MSALTASLTARSAIGTLEDHGDLEAARYLRELATEALGAAIRIAEVRGLFLEKQTPAKPKQTRPEVSRVPIESARVHLNIVHRRPGLAVVTLLSGVEVASGWGVLLANAVADAVRQWLDCVDDELPNELHCTMDGRHVGICFDQWDGYDIESVVELIRRAAPEWPWPEVSP
jgi:hypothetical protein